jgi:hypothetical protein
MTFYELRQYEVRPGKMAAWLTLMEEEIIPLQVAKGMVIPASFRGEADDSVYVWLRRFDLAAHRRADQPRNHAGAAHRPDQPLGVAVGKSLRKRTAGKPGLPAPAHHGRAPRARRRAPRRASPATRRREPRGPDRPPERAGAVGCASGQPRIAWLDTKMPFHSCCSILRCCRLLRHEKACPAHFS